MEVIFAVFRSRTHARIFFQALKDGGHACALVSTPTEAGVGCGASVKFRSHALPCARQIAYGYRLGGFVGFFKWARLSNKITLVKIE